MNETKQGILALLKSAVTQQPQPLPEGFDIEAAAPLIRSHHMATLAYEGAVLCGIPTGHPVMRSLRQSYCKAMLISEGQMDRLSRLFGEFEAAGIDYLPVKGCVLKALYPKPELRMMGDGDVLIRLEQYGRIVPILERLGFTSGGESDHELIWNDGPLCLELHKHLIPSYNEDLYGYFGDGWKLARRAGGSRWELSPEDTFVFLFTHFAKHYRDGGIGCRHVLDLWVYLGAHPALDHEKVNAALARLRLGEFYGNIRRLLEMWFEGGPGDERVDFISEYIFASGSWGRMEEHVTAAAVRQMRRTGRRENRLRYLWRLAFPGVDALKWKYTVLQKAPWLLPVVWLVRPFYKLIRERDSLDRHRSAARNLSRDKLDDHQRMLQFVGLC